MVEHAPPLVSIHDGNMLGGDDEGAPPMPTLARTTALAQPAVSGPHKAHRRRNVSRLTPHLCLRLCCAAAAGGGLAMRQHDGGSSHIARPSPTAPRTSHFELAAAREPRERA